MDRDAVRAEVEAANRAASRRDFATALTHLEAALEAAPEHLHALDLAGFVLFFLGRFAEAEPLLRAGLKG